MGRLCRSRPAQPARQDRRQQQSHDVGVSIIGVIAGLAVSLCGSPTASPVTAALCASEPLPPWLPAPLPAAQATPVAVDAARQADLDRGHAKLDEPMR